MIHLHRDPVQTIPSGASRIRRMSWTSRRATAARDRMADESARFTDVGFGEAMRDPLAQIARIYRRAGIDLTDDARAAMTAWRSRDAQEKLVKHTYTAQQFGLSDAQIRTEFAEYITRFLPAEERA